ncbi:thioesterase II family protein [Xenorhabdus eapokensis]|uniref:CFA synthetase, thioesterase component n=1 Tax=Xenorhabdus eapokensis TaxID=1873482 RepID=A0A1Q5TGT6_9GAMM|nr:thioesterase domain-containing protein [Xenorhabdus eapokensis]OKO99395.1 CFA synthetase, thioesterase component [Xenorhabdus eapokensis]
MKFFIYQALSAVYTKPYILFGHSFGTRLAFESALHQTRQDNPPRHMICSGARALHLHNHADPIHELPNNDFAEKLGQMGGTPEIIIKNNAMLDF